MIKIMQMDLSTVADTDASGKADVDDRNVLCVTGLRASHGVAQATILSQVASQGTGVVTVHNADMATH
jgi:hypothetical protein